MIDYLKFWLLPTKYFWKRTCVACDRQLISAWAIRRALFSLIHVKHEEAYWQVMGHNRGRQ